MPHARSPLVQQIHIVLAFGWQDFIQKYRGSVLGYLWSLFGPLTQFAVMLVVFRPLVGSSVPSYPLYLFLGIILWEHFTLTTNAALQLSRQKMHILSKVKVPPLLFIFSVAWTNLIIFCSRFVIFIFFALLWHMPSVIVGLWYLPFLLLQMTCLALGIGSALGAYSLRFKDIPHLWTVALQILFWLTPVLYAPLGQQTILDEIRLLTHHVVGLTDCIYAFIRWQPESMLIVDARRALGLLPEGAPSILHLLLFTAFCCAVFAGGAALYARRSKYFLQEY